MSKPDLWSRPDYARPLIAELKLLNSSVQPVLALEKSLRDWIELSALADPASDGAIVDEIALTVPDLRERLRRIEMQTFFRGKDDPRDAILSVRAGAGGVDAMDWAERLERMYWRWLTKAGFEAEIVDRLEGDQAGIHRTTIEVRGPYAFGAIRGEAGVHRVCHISEFDANHKKQTSFAAVEVLPIYPEASVDVREADLEVDTFCSGGPGGQNVNKVASAVRIRHLPSGITVKCQSQRSQLQNKRTALEILASRLHLLEEERRAPRGAKMEAAFGHKARTYVLQPYTLVKDHRTGHETGDVKAVLDGDLQGFVEASLRQDPRRGDL